MRYVTHAAIQYNPLWMSGPKATIPAGTQCVPADNLPEDKYSVLPWKGMTRRQRDYSRTVGYLLSRDEVTAI